MKIIVTVLLIVIFVELYIIERLILNMRRIQMGKAAIKGPIVKLFIDGFWSKRPKHMAKPKLF